MGKAEKLARLRAARSGKKIEDIDSDNDENVNIYDEVDETQYRKHKRDRVLNDDFIVDDNGEGYAETGADDWDSHNTANGNNNKRYNSDTDDEENGDEPKKLKKVKILKDSNTKSIDNFFKHSSEKKPKVKKETDISVLNDILSDFANDTKSSLKIKRPSNKSKNPFSVLNSHKLTTSTPSVKNQLNQSFSNNVTSASSDPFDASSPIKKKSKIENTTFFTAHEDINNSTISTPSSPIRNMNTRPIKSNDNTNLLDDLKNVSMDVSIQGPTDNDEESEDEDIIISKRKQNTTVKVDRSIILTSSKVKKPIDSSPLKNVKHIDIGSSPSRISNTSNISNMSNFSNITFEKLEGQDVVMKDEDGDEGIQMFWLDYMELNSSLLLFGKIKAKDGRLVSGMVQINGINKALYFLPRIKENEDIEDSDEANNQNENKKENERYSTMDIYDEIVPLLMDKYGLDSIKAKPETKKYAFEHYEIPQETEYLKVLLPFDTPKSQGVVIPSNLTGDTFQAVFGTNSSIFESFVLQRQIMGPCWLTITSCDFTSLQNVSHCNIELSVSSPIDIQQNLYTRDPPPPLNILSINVQPFMNAEKNRQEIGLISLALYKDIPQDVPLSKDLQPTETITLIRPVANSLTLPVGLKNLADKKGIPLRLLNNEKILLNCLVGLVKKYDPDVFVGHRLENVTLDILLHRMRDLNINNWSNMGRLSKKKFPEKFSRSNGRYNLFLIREMLAGRLLCDISNEMGQSLTTKCQNWELAEMYDVVCGEKYTPIEINLANPLVSEDAPKLLAIINENLLSVKIIAKTSFTMQILSISKQLTNIAGNAWSHTLGGTRAGRNEYILLHEFERENYIVPDKETRKQREETLRNGTSSNFDNVENEDATNVNNKKSKFKGGLVFDPVKGLHKNFVLVMDFNSLYPSIIQEFNICFTTVDRSNLHDDEELPKVPNKKDMGVLPKLLKQLVTRRKEVKSLMKDPKLTAQEKSQLDIKQLSLKLTANSMYGCLGYVNSRFYAKPLAMLVTNKGREILMDTKQLAESLGLTVVYGDTDSVMIDTRAESYTDAIKVGNEFKIKVNERYKLLEIDIDNIFKSVLFTAKKRYAAFDCKLDKEGNEVCKLEVKGLDMKRREYCPLSKELSIFVLNNILSKSDLQEAFNEIYKKFEEVKNEFKENKIPMIKLRINTKLSKDPNKYPGGKSMPSVQVALRLQKQGKIVKAGNVITYVVTLGEPNEIKEGETADQNMTEISKRSRALNEVLNKDYKPDIRYYSEKQIFNPIDRLLNKVEGYDVVRLADSLGLESQKYEEKARNLNKDNGLQPLESTIPDKERFKDTKDLQLHCIKCNTDFKFGGIQSSDDYKISFKGIECKKCSFLFYPLLVSAQLEIFIRNEIDKYYEFWLQCDNCGLETRQISVYGRRCIGFNGTAHECKGVMKVKYTDKQIFNQLLYLKSLFDADKAISMQLKPIDDKENSLSDSDVKTLAEQNRREFENYSKVVQKYLDVNGRNYVDLGSIFRCS